MYSKINRRVLRKMGYLADQEGIIRRYLREQGGWDSHLMRCRDYILEKADHYGGDTVTILGSGWLLDVPLEELAERKKLINLIDINHPRQVRAKVKAFSRVKLITSDITGGLIENVWRELKKNPPSLDAINVPVPHFDFDPGLLVSLNILTQTDTLLVDFLLRKTNFERGEYRKFRGRVQKAHLNLLGKYSHLLISDYEEEIRDSDSKELIERRPLLFTGEELSGGDTEEWSWLFDSSGEYYRRKHVVFKVIAIDNTKYEQG